MNTQVSVLCDAATDDNGKLNLLGAFDTIYTRQLPAVHPQCSIALRVTFDHEDEGEHQLRFSFMDADGRSIMPPIEIPVKVALESEAYFGTRNFIINIQQLGLYAIDVAWDDTPKANIPLVVKQRE
jgi:hypothetical protein